MKFKTEDFYVCDEVVDGNKCTREHEISLSDKECADLANARLAQMLAEATVAKLTKTEFGFRQWTDSGLLGTLSPTHTARLVDIRPLAANILKSEFAPFVEAMKTTPLKNKDNV